LKKAKLCRGLGSRDRRKIGAPQSIVWLIATRPNLLQAIPVTVMAFLNQGGNSVRR